MGVELMCHVWPRYALLTLLTTLKFQEVHAAISGWMVMRDEFKPMHVMQWVLSGGVLANRGDILSVDSR